MDRPQLTSLLPNAVLDRLGRLRIVPRGKHTNRTRGEHLAGKGGTSTEFCDYRDYVPGDDTRFVDWNIFARLHRPYLKQFHQEEERHVVLLVDSSASMLSEEKFDRARQLAAAFGALGLLNHERVSVYDFSSDRRLPACRGRANLRRVFGHLEGLTGGGDTPLETAVDRLLKYHRGRGVCLVVSDFLTFGDLTRPFNLLYAAGLELFGVQILGPAEIDPPLSGDLRLVDVETQGNLDVSTAAQLLEVYQEYRLDYEQRLAAACARRAGRFVSIRSDATIDWVLFDLMRRQGWVE